MVEGPKNEVDVVAGAVVVVAPNSPVAGAVVVVVPNILSVGAGLMVVVGCPNSDPALLSPNKDVAERAVVLEAGSKMDFRFAAGSKGTVVSRFKLVNRLLLAGADVEVPAAAGWAKNDMSSVMAGARTALYAPTVVLASSTANFCETSRLASTHDAPSRFGTAGLEAQFLAMMMKYTRLVHRIVVLVALLTSPQQCWYGD